MTDPLKKKSLNCPLIRIRVKESAFPGSRAESADAVRKTSSDPAEKNQPSSPYVVECSAFENLYWRGGGEQK